MFNTVLKYFQTRFVANFMDLSIIFLCCAVLLNLESTFSVINIAKASTLSRYDPTIKAKAIQENFANGLISAPFEAPRVEFLDDEGKNYTLKDFRKKLTILYFWATWSSNCVDELEKLYALGKELKHREIEDIVIVPISVDFKTPSYIAEYLSKKGIPNLKFYIDPKKEMMGALNVQAIPRSFIINELGEVVASFKYSVQWSHSDIIQSLIDLGNKISTQTVENPQGIENSAKEPMIQKDISDKTQKNSSTFIR